NARIYRTSYIPNTVDPGGRARRGLVDKDASDFNHLPLSKTISISGYSTGGRESKRSYHLSEKLQINL
ncbi:hypothetical protein QYM36_000526, partial [Artemia franciscana]